MLGFRDLGLRDLGFRDFLGLGLNALILRSSSKRRHTSSNITVARICRPCHGKTAAMERLPLKGSGDVACMDMTRTLV